MRKRLIRFSLLVFVAFAFPVWNAVASGLEDGLILHLTFEEKDPMDHSPKPADVSLKGGSLKLVNGKIGKAAEFGGSTYVEVADADKLDGMDALTIAAWIRPAKSGGDGMSIASKRVDWQKEDAYNLFIYTGNKLDARIDASGDFWSTTVFDAGTWYHIAYVFDGKANQQRIYVNGELDAEGIQGKSEVPEFNSPLWIGELNQGRNFIYSGLMDELGIWNRALDEDEIKLTMQGITTPVESQGKLTTTWGNIKWER